MESASAPVNAGSYTPSSARSSMRTTSGRFRESWWINQALPRPSRLRRIKPELYRLTAQRHGHDQPGEAATLFSPIMGARRRRSTRRHLCGGRHRRRAQLRRLRLRHAHDQQGQRDEIHARHNLSQVYDGSARERDGDKPTRPVCRCRLPIMEAALRRPTLARTP